LLPSYKKEGDGLFAHKNGGFLQDETSSHTARKAQEWCKKNFKFFFPKETRLLYSPKLNPLDSSIWNNISNHVEYHKVTTVNDLRGEIIRAMKKVDITYAQEVIAIFLRRVHQVEKHDSVLIIDKHNSF